MTYFVNLSSHLSPWTIIFICAERTFVVYFPLKTKSYLTRKNVVRAWLCMATIFALVNVWSVFYVGLHTDDSSQTVQICRPSSDKMASVMYLVNVSILVLAIPFPLILLCNIALLVGLRINQQKRRLLTSEVERKNITVELKRTIMLLTVSFTYLFITLPAAVYQPIIKAFPQLVNGYRPYETILNISAGNMLTSFLNMLNSCINFFLYAYGPEFRKEIINTFKICGSIITKKCSKN